jgi:hypothetical protein
MDHDVFEAREPDAPAVSDSSHCPRAALLRGIRLTLSEEAWAAASTVVAVADVSLSAANGTLAAALRVTSLPALHFYQARQEWPDSPEAWPARLSL